MKTILIALGMFAATGFIFRDDLAGIFNDKKNKKSEKFTNQTSASTDINIRQKWELPPILLEVSGIAWMDAQRFACVQDEAGTIFIYNTADRKIEKEIAFTGPGDFEGISLNGNTAFVVRSDGRIFEVDMSSKQTKEYPSGLTLDNNVETMFFDKANNRLLLAGKEPDQDKAFKNIYAFNLAINSMEKTPIMRIDLGNPVFDAGSKSKKKKNLMPSAIAIHPVSKDVYMLDGPKSRLVVLKNDAEVKNVYKLGSEFYKPEGISFSPTGDLYISNEGKKIPANIIQLELTK